MRIDKYIWAIRMFKKRSLANKACNNGKVLLNNEITKAGKYLKLNDIISIKEMPLYRDFLVLKFPNTRIGAKLVKEFAKEITSKENLKILNQSRQMNLKNRNLGFKGRPTKKKRRTLDKLSF